MEPKIDYYTELFGGTDFKKGENIIFVNSVEDPWKYASLMELKWW